VKLSYNPLRQLIEIQDWLGSTRITPDALGRAEKVQYPDGREVSYTYIATVAPSLYQWIINSMPQMATCGG